MNELIAAYKEVAPNVTINYETTQNDYPTLLKSRINAGTTPTTSPAAPPPRRWTPPLRP